MKSLLSVLASGSLMLAALTASAQIHPSRLPAVHPIPSAPTRVFVPASFSALPELQCKLYPEGSDVAKALTVFTDDDGYARFHAVRATASDAVQRLALDCANSAGKSYSYSIDLTSDDTFAPRPLNLANERGTDRPALKGDPLSYSQTELIQAGYAPRPDPSDADAYERWLAAATVPGRMLSAKRSIPSAHRQAQIPSTRITSQAASSQTHSTAGAVATPNSVTKITEPWWTGSILNGTPNYAAVEANMNVPTAIPGGDETSNTQVAIWDGVEGATGALIQGGVGAYTDGPAAGYWSWREYCCGNGASNNYSGAFTPNPGDNIYAVNWYCDSAGKISLNGGYGCTHLHDITTGAILDCSLPSGSPCPSVKALAGWTFGHDADFVIENQTPQNSNLSSWSATTAYAKGQIASYNAYPYICLVANTNEVPSTQPGYWRLYQVDMAFTDFTPQVKIVGTAYSTATGKYSQNVSNDPLVDIVEDFTNSSSHMNVSLGTTNQTYFSVSQFKRVAGLASNAASAESIGVGPNANGSQVGDAWTLGFNPDANGDYAIYQWKNSKWVNQIGAATHIAVGPEGYPWVVNHLGNIYYWNGTAFEPAPGSACASWIGVGYNNHGSTYGGPWILGCHEGTGGYSIYQLQGSTWVLQPGSAVKLTMGPRGPWVISTQGTLYYWNGTTFVAGPAGCATSIGVGSLTAPFAGPWGDVWITGCTLDGNDYHIYQLQYGTVWAEIAGLGTQISVSPDLGIPWVVNSLGEIFQ